MYSWALGADALVQVHSVVVVIVDKIDGASNEIYGEIKAVDCANCMYNIYNVEKNDAKSISADGMLPLTGPSQCIMNPPNFVIGVCLKERGLDLEVSNGHFCLTPNSSYGWYDRLKSVIILGEHGYAVLHLSVLRKAVQATVDVNLVHTNSYVQKPRIPIHGDIVAKYSTYKYKGNYARKHHPTALLNATKDKPVELQPLSQYDEPSPAKVARYHIDEPSPRKVKPSTDTFKIPLSRCTVAVPCDCELVIEANLWENVGTDLPENVAQVGTVSGIATFYADQDVDGTITEIIEGRNCHIEVKVTWFADVKYKVYQDAFVAKSEGRQQIY